MRWFTVFGLLITLTFITACGKPEGQRPGSRDAGMTLTYVISDDVKTLRPQGTSWLIDFRMIELAYEPLLKVEPESMEIYLATAEDYTVSDDGLTYTFTIREDARWSNGDPVTSHDYLFAWKEAMLPERAADYAALFYTIKGAREFFDFKTNFNKTYIENLEAKGGEISDEALNEVLRMADEYFEENVGLKAIDDRTLEVTLAQPTAYFPELVAFAPFAPVHKASVSQELKLNRKTGTYDLFENGSYFFDPDRIVTNGAFVLHSHELEQRMVMKKNPMYWNADAVELETIVMEVNDDLQNAYTQYRNGNIDWMPGFALASDLGIRLAKEARAGERDDFHIYQAAGTYYYSFNCRPEIDGKPNPLADPRVRRALSLAIDRETMVNNVTQLGEPIAKTFTPPGAIPGYEPPIDAGVSFDPEAARQLLAEAGYPNGEGLTGLSILINSEGGAHNKQAQAIQSAWQTHLNITVPIDSVERKQFSTKRRSGQFTIARGGWFGDYIDPTTFLDLFRTGDSNNDGRYSNPEFDSLLKQAEAELDRDQRMALLRQAEAVIIEEQALAPLYHLLAAHVFDPDRVKGLTPNPWNIRRLELLTIADEGQAESASESETN